MRRFCVSLLVSSLAFAQVSILAQATSTAAPAKKAAGPARTVELTASDPSAPSGKYGFSPATIDAKPGERLHIVMKALGTMPAMASSHNFIVFKPGTTQAQIDDFVAAAMTASATGYIPAAKKAIVLANTPMATDGAGPVEVTFTAPTAPGSYTFECSFPGHAAAGMKGTLVVK